MDNVIKTIEHRMETGSRFTIVAVAEGAISKEDAALSKKEYKKKLAERTSPSIVYDIAKEIEAKTGRETRVAIPGHTQRGGQPDAQDRIFATQCGVEAALGCLRGEFGYMIALRDGKMCHIPLEEVAGKLKYVDPQSDLVREAKALGIDTKPVFIGPYTFLKLARTPEATELELDKGLVNAVAAVYVEVLAKFNELGAAWVQLDEPYLVLDKEPGDVELFKSLYAKILPAREGKVKVLLNTYFGHIADVYETVNLLGFAGIGLDLNEGKDENLAAVEKYGSNVLKLYLPGEYLGENVISDFEKQFGVRVIVENFDSNEMMYTKLMAGDRYDVVIPSDYMIERLMKEDFLQPLDKSLIPNMENMDDAVRGMSYDPQNDWSIPYFWGSVGLVYNHENVDPAVIESEGWEILRNTDYAGHVYIYDSERDSFMMAFKALGYSMNTEDPDEINAAYEWLLQMNNTMSPVYVTDEVIDGMMNGYKDIAVVYSGDAAVVLDENEDMSFYMPSQGTNIWCDAMVIPQNAENPKLAHEFINYMLTYEAAFDNTETVGYTSPNAEVFEEMTSSEDLYADNAAYLPRSGYDKDEMFHDNQTLMRELSRLWIKVKAAK